MDAEAVDIFWGYIDRYWYTDMTTDELFVKVFTLTGNTIMKVAKTKEDIIWASILVAGGLVALGLGLVWWLKKRKAEKERAEETERILNTPINGMGSMGTMNTFSVEDLTEKYK